MEEIDSLRNAYPLQWEEAFPSLPHLCTPRHMIESELEMRPSMVVTRFLEIKWFLLGVACVFVADSRKMPSSSSPLDAANSHFSCK